MTADTEAPAEAVAEETKAQADTAAEATQAGAKTVEKVTKKARKATVKARRKTKPGRAKPQTATRKRNNHMKFDPTNVFAGFGAFPGAAAFEKIFAETAQRSEEAAARSRKAVEELADIYRSNVDAFVEAGRIATSGAQSIGQDIVAKSRDNLEQTANTVRSFAEAKSATELLQLQSDFARSAFDRFVEESSALTESVVKLAGEAFQPISNRASANVERLNEIAA